MSPMALLESGIPLSLLLDLALGVDSRAVMDQEDASRTPERLAQ